jgi:BirA family biotin operon repressor/biotin-[acetyl-CoA-carboxylase] ligase
MPLQTLLSLLSDGQFHSGDELGARLGVSRTAVWKQLKKVQELGLPLQSIKGKGYCIDGGLDLLNEKLIRQHLDPEVRALITALDVEGVVDSTNALAMAKTGAGANGYVCTAEQQTAGRGRRGRRWHSPYASNLYLSVVWEFVGGAASLEGLSLAVGVAVVDALQQAGVVGARLKWPNDVLHESRKMSGVLLEMVGDAAGPCQVVVGVGLNVAMNPVAAKMIDQPWVDLQSVSELALSRSHILALLLNQLMPLLAGFERKGFASYRERWQQLDAYADREVALTLGQDVVVGWARGVDLNGALIVQTAAGPRTFNGGEVSLRSAG